MSLEAQITSLQESGNTASIGLLRTQLSKVKTEIATEEQVKTNIKVFLIRYTILS